ncbi:MAG: hypothetical protein ACK5MW_02385 [Enterococcus sp.]
MFTLLMLIIGGVALLYGLSLVALIFQGVFALMQVLFLTVREAFSFFDTSSLRHTRMQQTKMQEFEKQVEQEARIQQRMERIATARQLEAQKKEARIEELEAEIAKLKEDRWDSF